MSSNSQQTADITTALQHAARLLNQDPVLAAEQARAILKSRPESASALLILGAACRLQGDIASALGIVEPLAVRNPNQPNILHELALCFGALGQGDKSIATLRQALQLDPTHSASWRSLGDQLRAAGDDKGSEEAYEKHLAASTRHPELIQAADFLRVGKIAQAEKITREILKRDPVDVVAIRMLAEIGIKVGQIDDAITLLQRCLELAPDFHLARQNYAVALSRRQRLDEAIAQMDRLLIAEPDNPNFQLMKGSFQVQKGDHQPALHLYEKFIRDYPKQAGAHMNYGHTLKTVGRLDDSIKAYRNAIELRPATGEAYWSLANLKTFRFSDDDIASMRSQVVPEGGDPDDQAHLLFALGKALEDRGKFDDAFENYRRGNQIRGKQHRHDAKINVFNTARQMKTLNAEFFESRRGQGFPAADPILIVGLPRSGSTLLEQILASHSQVEGTAELPDIIALSRKLGKRSQANPAGRYPEILTELTPAQLRELGESYIETTQIQRHGEPYFIDKMPNNFQHIGFIHLILPNAKIVDARRHPMACCFSGFKQLFARGQKFSYDLADIGHYYRDYVTLMDHWDAVLPGCVHRVQYEDMVADTESQIRRLLDYCGLEFEDQCLRFYETDRAIRTPSSEQVRQPVYKEGLEHWRNFEKHLGPLKEALGPLLDRYPID